MLNKLVLGTGWVLSVRLSCPAPWLPSSSLLFMDGVLGKPLDIVGREVCVLLGNWKIWGQEWRERDWLDGGGRAFGNTWISCKGKVSKLVFFCLCACFSVFEHVTQLVWFAVLP